MIQNTFNWYSGEIFEAKFILGFGLFLALVAVLFYYIGKTPASKAIVIPFLTLAVVIVFIGSYMIYSNSQKMETLQAQHDTNPIQFQQDEIKRVEDFQYLYPMSIAISLVSFLVALGLLYFVKNIHWQAIAVTLIFFGATFGVIDYFSKERATIYYEQLKLNINDVGE
ncbi:MAG: manganese efflux pump [Bacteroidales bacterium]